MLFFLGEVIGINLIKREIKILYTKFIQKLKVLYIKITLDHQVFGNLNIKSITKLEYFLVEGFYFLKLIRISLDKVSLFSEYFPDAWMHNKITFDKLLLKYQEASELTIKEPLQKTFIQICEYLDDFHLNTEIKSHILQHIANQGFNQHEIEVHNSLNLNSQYPYSELSLPEYYSTFMKGANIISPFLSYQLSYDVKKSYYINLFGCDSFSPTSKNILFSGQSERIFYHSPNYRLPEIYIYDISIDKVSKINLTSTIETFFRNNKIKNLYGKMVKDNLFIFGTWGVANQAKLIKLEIIENECSNIEDITPTELLNCDDIFVQSYDHINKNLKIGIKPGIEKKEMFIGYLNISSNIFNFIRIPKDLNISEITRNKWSHLYIHQWYPINEEFYFVILTGIKGSYIIVIDHEGSQYAQYYFSLKSDMHVFSEFLWQHNLKHIESPYLYISGGTRTIYRFHFNLKKKYLNVLKLPLHFYGEISAICATQNSCYLSFYDNSNSYVARLDEFNNIRVVFSTKEPMPITQLSLDTNGDLIV